MIKAKFPEYEKDRIKELESFQILDSLPEEDFDNITKLAAKICNMPVSLVSLLDEKRQWFKSIFGLDVRETSRDFAFCGHAILDPNEVMIINDARKDPRFIGNPLVNSHPNVVFYAGVPLNTENGFPLGTLCVIDHKENNINDEQKEMLVALSKQVIRNLELRRELQLTSKIKANLDKKSKELEQFAITIGHDFDSPIHEIIDNCDNIEEGLGVLTTNQILEISKKIKRRADSLKKLVEDILLYSKSHYLEDRYSTIYLNQIIDESIMNIEIPDALELRVSKIDEVIYSGKSALKAIFFHLISNAVKYNDKGEKAWVGFEFENLDKEYRFHIFDNGPGINPESRESVFELFHTLGHKSYTQGQSFGLGLATVQKAVENLGGKVQIVDSKEGTHFVVQIPKA